MGIGFSMRNLLRKLALCGAFVALGLPARAGAGDPPSLPVLWECPGFTFMDSCPAIGRNGVIYFTSSMSGTFFDSAAGELVAVATNGVQQWTFKTFLEIKSSPAIGPDGTVYFGCRDRRLYAITTAGTARWSFLTGAWVDSSPPSAPTASSISAPRTTSSTH